MEINRILVSAETDPALQVVRVDDVAQDGGMVPVALLVTHHEHVVFPWINFR